MKRQRLGATGAKVSAIDAQEKTKLPIETWGLVVQWLPLEKRQSLLCSCRELSRLEVIFDMKDDKHIFVCNVLTEDDEHLTHKEAVFKKLRAILEEGKPEYIERLERFKNLNILLRDAEFFGELEFWLSSRVNGLIISGHSDKDTRFPLRDTLQLGGYKLQELDLSGCHALENVHGLNSCSTLRVLDLSYCLKLKNVDGLGGCASLQSLDLHKCEALTNISGLHGCSTLQWLNLSNCVLLTDLSGLQNCSSLEHIILFHCINLVSVSALAGCSSLRTVNASFCHFLTDISALASCSLLQEVDLWKCISLEDVSPLAACSLLRTLDLSHCTSLKTIELDDCTSLVNIRAVGCLINEVSMPKGCKMQLHVW